VTCLLTYLLTYRRAVFTRQSSVRSLYADVMSWPSSTLTLRRISLLDAVFHHFSTVCRDHSGRCVMTACTEGAVREVDPQEAMQRLHALHARLHEEESSHGPTQRPGQHVRRYDDNLCSSQQLVDYRFVTCLLGYFAFRLPNIICNIMPVSANATARRLLQEQLW